MDEYRQFSAKTKGEAITQACIEMGTTSDQLDIQVISEGSSGFFGIGSKPAVIRVRNRKSQNRKNRNRKSRSRKNQSRKSLSRKNRYRKIIIPKRIFRKTRRL